MPYAASAGLLSDVLPIASGTNATTLRQHTLLVAERAEAELGEEPVSGVKTRPTSTLSSRLSWFWPLAYQEVLSLCGLLCVTPTWSCPHYRLLTEDLSTPTTD